MLRKLLAILMATTLTQAHVLALETPAPAEVADVQAEGAPEDAPQAPGLRHRGSDGPGLGRPIPGRNPRHGGPGWGQGPGQNPGQNGHLDPWLLGELGRADWLMAQGSTFQARDLLVQIRMTLQAQPDPRYRQIAQGVGAVEWDLQNGNLAGARQRLAWLVRQIQQGQGGNGWEKQQVIRELHRAYRFLSGGQAFPARRILADEYQRMVRSQDFQLRQEAQYVAYADRLAAANRILEAAQHVNAILHRLGAGNGGGGGGGWPNDPDQANRREWRKDIRDLIDTIQDGNIRMAQRDLETLIRDIRQDGHDWSKNRVYVQKLQFIGQNLQPGNQHWCIRELRQLERELDF